MLADRRTVPVHRVLRDPCLRAVVDEEQAEPDRVSRGPTRGCPGATIRRARARRRPLPPHPAIEVTTVRR